MSVKRLGKGLSALIRPEEEQKKNSPVKTERVNTRGIEILIKAIRANPNQPRREFNDIALEELVASIRAKGVITPVTVREVEEGYELVAGERRWRASKKLRKKTIPAYVIEVKDDAEIMEIALIENIQREALNPLEESEAYAVLNSKFDMSHEAIARSVGKKRTTVSNALRLLKLPSDIRKSLRKGEISSGHARAILQAKTGLAMNKLWRLILDKDLSVRSAEALVKVQKNGLKRKKVRPRKKSLNVMAMENHLIEVLGTKVKLKKGKKGGSIEVSFFSDDDLERIFELLNSIS